jgi:hypothetical protein
MIAQKPTEAFVYLPLRLRGVLRIKKRLNNCLSSRFSVPRSPSTPSPFPHAATAPLQKQPETGKERNIFLVLDCSIE